MTKPSEIFIIGGGVSLTKGIEIGLLDFLRDKCCLTLNCSMFNYPLTCGVFCDYSNFYEHFFIKNNNPPQQPELMITKFLDSFKEKDKKHIKIQEDVRTCRIILIKHSDTNYYRDIARGCYSNVLTGLFALSLAIYLLDTSGTIWLCGYDCGVAPIDDKVPTTIIRGQKLMVDDTGNFATHAYKTKHGGVGKIDIYYDKHKRNRKAPLFDIYKNEQQVRILNVCPSSSISTFEKIDYQTMFKLSDGIKYSQEELRDWIRERLNPIGVKF